MVSAGCISMLQQEYERKAGVIRRNGIMSLLDGTKNDQADNTE